MLQSVSPDPIKKPISPYEMLIRRIHRQINSSAAQSQRRTVISLLPGESTDDWDTFLEQLDIEESVRVTRIEHGSAYLQWRNQHLGCV